MDISTRLEQIATLAKQAPEMAFTTLGHHIDFDLLCEAFERTNWRSAPGVDGVKARAYMEDLESNLRSLLERAKSGIYRAPPVRRVHIPKGSGSETRPIGIPTLEDKVLQRAVCMILEAIYEQDFLDCSYGFRPGRNVHQALEALWQQTMQMGGCWLLEVDIRKYFDTLDHAHLKELLQQRVRDGVLRRLIHQGPRAPGGHGLSRTFDFLGFTHFWGVSRKGNRVVQRKTAKKRFTRSLLKVAAWCRQNRHLRVALQHVMLCMKVRGHYQFYGITGNYRALARFTHAVARVWRKWLNRRSERRRMPWDRFKRLLARYPLPAPRVAQSVFRSVAKP
jgi:hypothetical protein